MMSATPHSPPDTPARPGTMTVEKDGLKMSQSQRLEVKPITQPVQHPSSELERVEVPATQLASVVGDDERIDDRSLPLGNQRGNGQSSNTNPEKQNEEQGQKTNECQNEKASNAPLELADFDWTDLETRYNEAMKEAEMKEIVLFEEFEKMVKYFGLWSTSTSQYDKGRSLKRFKTREAYVQIAEHDFELKKQHYLQVVQAFKTALELLRDP